MSSLRCHVRVIILQPLIALHAVSDECSDSPAPSSTMSTTLPTRHPHLKALDTVIIYYVISICGWTYCPLYLSCMTLAWSWSYEGSSWNGVRILGWKKRTQTNTWFIQGSFDLELNGIQCCPYKLDSQYKQSAYLSDLIQTLWKMNRAAAAALARTACWKFGN